LHAGKCHTNWGERDPIFIISVHGGKRKKGEKRFIDEHNFLYQIIGKIFHFQEHWHEESANSYIAND
jgi:hypothetical protein